MQLKDDKITTAHTDHVPHPNMDNSSVLSQQCASFGFPQLQCTQDQVVSQLTDDILIRALELGNLALLQILSFSPLLEDDCD